MGMADEKLGAVAAGVIPADLDEAVRSSPC